MTTVVVLGATGAMGERVCQGLRRWAPGVLVVGANRSGTGHRDFPVRPADVTRAATLAPVLRGADLLVNAVGPYAYDPTPAVQACIDAGVHYVDLAEGRAFVSAVVRAARARGAARAGIVVAPGASTVPGLVTLLATRWRMDADVAALSAWLSMGSRNPVSRGLLTGLLAPLGRPDAEGRRWFTRLARLETDGRRLAFGRYPIALPDAGMPMAVRRVPVRLHVGFDRAALTAALVAAAPLLGRLPPGAVARLAGALRPLAALARPFGTHRGVLAVVARDAAGAERGRIEVRARRRGLDVPALPPVWIAARLHAEGALPARGAAGLADLVTLEDAVARLRAAGYEVTGDLPPGLAG